MAIVAVTIISCEEESFSDSSLLSIDNSGLTIQDSGPDIFLETPDGCTTIQSGNIENSLGQTIATGWDDYGYNYQAHKSSFDIFPGFHLTMKWNDAWLSNKDCDGDGLLDKHYGSDGFIGSGAWLTNHFTSTYINGEGNECEYDAFIKIIAAPEDAYVVPENANGITIPGIWYYEDGTEIGPSYNFVYIVIQSIINDPCAGIEGLDYKSPDHSGLGGW